MVEDNFTLTTFYASWKEYQEQLEATLAVLTAEQLTLRAAPGLRSVRENVVHIVGARAFWFHEFLREEGGEDLKRYCEWNASAVSGATEAPVPTAAELVRALDSTWHYMAGCLARWSPGDMRQAFPDEWEGKPVELSRAWVVWHVLEHDLHHGGEVSLTLGMYGISARFAG